MERATRRLVARPPAHLATCLRCAGNVSALDQLALGGGKAPELLSLSTVERRWMQTRWPRVVLALLGVALVVLAVPQFIGTGVAPTGRHAARHLATWQAGFGCGLTIAAFRSRFGEALLALAASVAALTALATAIDVVAGHRGPVAELVHLVELGGIAALWWLAPPHLRPRFTAGRRVRSAAADHRPAGLVLVSDLVSDRSAR